MTDAIRPIRVLAAMAALSVVAPVHAQQEPAIPPPAISDGMRVGGEWGTLDGPFERAALSGQREARYRLERTNLVLDRRGKVLVREISSAIYRRVPADDAGGARFAWERFTVRREQGGATAREQEIPLPGTPTFTLDTANFALSMVEAMPGPQTNAGEFRVLVIDALTWDLMLAGLWRGPGARVAIGQNVPLERPAEPQPVPGGTYEMGASALRVAGVTRVGGEPCLEVNFAIEGSEVSIASAGVAFSGHEYVRGQVAISLRDGRVVAGQFWGPVIATFRQGAEPGAPELPLGGILQYVTLRELPSPSSNNGRG